VYSDVELLTSDKSSGYTVIEVFFCLFVISEFIVFTVLCLLKLIDVHTHEVVSVMLYFVACSSRQWHSSDQMFLEWNQDSTRC